jgi:hypothetical protein
MLGPIIVSSVAVGLPVVAGLWLAPEQKSRHFKWVPLNRVRDYVRLLSRPGEVRIPLKDLRSVLR